MLELSGKCSMLGASPNHIINHAHTTGFQSLTTASSCSGGAKLTGRHKEQSRQCRQASDVDSMGHDFAADVLWLLSGACSSRAAVASGLCRKALIQQLCSKQATAAHGWQHGFANMSTGRADQAQMCSSGSNTSLLQRMLQPRAQPSAWHACQPSQQPLLMRNTSCLLQQRLMASAGQFRGVSAPYPVPSSGRASWLHRSLQLGKQHANCRSMATWSLATSHYMPSQLQSSVRHKWRELLRQSQLSWPPILPSWPSWWPAWEAVYRSSVKWLPSVPGTRAAYLDVLSALNLSGAGGALLHTAALTAVELSRATRAVAAQGFDMQLPPHLITNDTSNGPQPHWLLASLLTLVEAIINITRAAWLACIFTPVILSAPLALHINMYRAEWMELLRRTLEAGGPAFIKWGQWAATRHDLFPPDMCAELEQLHSQAPAHHFRHTKRAIAESFGMHHGELFDWIEHKPVASGSIGQIHRARLSERGAALTGFEAGQLVAVKVRHPGVADTILRDFSTMMGIAHIAAKLPALSHLRLEDTLKQFAAPLKEQVDLAREASNLQRFNYNFRNTSAVQFPVPLYPLVSSEVLVETYEEGDHISKYIAATDSPINHRLSIIGSGTMLQMMLMDNLIHSDLHPGNILVRLTPPGGLLGLLYNGLDRLKQSPGISNKTRARVDVVQQRWLQPQMVLLDVGMATELSDEDQKNMVGLFRSFAAMDGISCGKWTLAFSGDQQQCPHPEDFTAAMGATFDELRRLDEGATWEETQFRNSADTLSHVLELVRQYRVTLPGHICAVVVTTMVLEGWSNKLDPSHSVLTQVQKMFSATNEPWLTRMMGTVDTVMEEEVDQLATV